MCTLSQEMLSGNLWRGSSSAWLRGKWGTHVYLWQIHVDVWQNQYNTVKQLTSITINKFIKKKEKVSQDKRSKPDLTLARDVIISVAHQKDVLCTFSQRRQWQPTLVLLPGKSRGRRSLVGCSPWGRTESDTTEATQQQQHILCCRSNSPEVNSIISVHFFSGKTDSHRKLNPGQVAPQMSPCGASLVVSVTQTKLWVFFLYSVTHIQVATKA